MPKLLAALLGGALLISGAGAHAADPAPLKVTKPEAAKGVQTVVIGAFNVGFLFESVDSGKATGGLIGAFGGATSAKSVLVGVTPAMMQAVVDAAYADFTAQLGAKGYTVADSATMFSSAAFERVKPGASPLEASIVLEKNSKGKTDYYKPSALPGLVTLPGDVTPSGLSGMGITMASGMTAYGMAQHAKTSGQAVIDVVYLIDFSNAKRPGAFSFGGIKVNSGMAVVAEYSKLSVVAPNGKTAIILLKQPVAVEGEFATMEDTTGGFNKGSQAALNVLSGLGGAFGMGGAKFGNTRKFTFTAKPGAYEEGATKAATLANAKVVEQLAALR